MKKGLLVGFFSLLALAPFSCALAQAVSKIPAVKAVEESSTGAVNRADDRQIRDPAPEANAGNTTARNQTTSPTLAESTEAISNVLLKAVSKAERNYNAGVALYDSGKLDEAISAFKEADKLKPKDPQTQYMLGMVYWKAAAYNDALDSYKRAVRFKPDWAEAHFRLGLTYYVLGRESQTNEAYKRLLQLNSTLANKLYQINSDADPTHLIGNLRAEAPASVSKQVESNLPSTTAISSDAATAPVIRTAISDPASSSKVLTTDDSAMTDIYKVGVGDVLDIRLLNSATNRSTLYSVIEGGLIDFPIAGGLIPVAGLTTKDIQERITSKLKHSAVEERTEVAVGVRQYASHTVIITGLCSSPGTKILRREGVPLYVLLAEVQPRLDAARAAISRAGAPTQVVELNDSAPPNFIIRAGDVINLTVRPQDFYYISGRISYPGQKAFHPGITLVQALLAAGGLTRDNVIELSRQGSDGHLGTTKFNVNEIKSGKIEDPKLQPGDRLEVFH
jgi:protein involved in polysaccharide export with SLBB domain/Flp pilus assembly protein TadD